MSYQEYATQPGCLREAVDCQWSTGPEPKGSTGPEPNRSPGHRVLPDGCVDILVDVARGEAFVVGTMTRALVVPASDLSEYCAVRFRPGGAAAFFDGPIHALTDLRVPLGEVWPGAQRLIDSVLEAPGMAERVRVFAAGLAQRVAGRAPLRDPLLGAAIHAIESDPSLRVATLAERLGVSRQHLTRCVRRAVGVGPKELARVLRFCRVAAAARASAEVDWAALALDTGYADQAHLSREFRALAGISPGRYLAEQGSIRSKPAVDRVAS